MYIQRYGTQVKPVGHLTRQEHREQTDALILSEVHIFTQSHLWYHVCRFPPGSHTGTWICMYFDGHAHSRGFIHPIKELD